MYSKTKTTTFSARSPRLAMGLLLASSALAAGCYQGDGGAEPLVHRSGEARLLRGGDGALLVLGGDLEAGGAIARLATDFDLLSPADLGGLSVPPSADLAAEMLEGTRGVLLDLAAASDGELLAWKPIIDAALKHGVPLIMENATDPTRLAGAIGIGVAADLVMVTSDGPNRHHVRVYGDHSVLDDYLAERAGDVEVAPAATATLEAGLLEVGEALRRAPGRSTLAATAVPTNGYQYFLLDFPAVQLTLVSGRQSANLDLDFEAELALDAARGKKVLFVRPVGSGQHPGALYANGDGKRGYYQESIRVSVVPFGGNEGNVALYDHQPASPNSNSTYTSSTGWTIGVSGQDPQLSYSQSEQETTTLPDFSMVNDTSGQIAKWTFKMSRSWQDMVQIKGFTCKVRDVPNLAKSNLRPNFEALYRAESSYRGTVGFRLEVDTVFREVSRTHKVVVCDKHTTSKSYFRTKSLSVNFGAI
jgi:hypothetical protein